jgi:protein arginine kinase
LQAVLESASRLDRELEPLVPFASSRAHGYLTACPTNVGTGMRASVLIHLPGLALAGESKRVQRAVSEMGMAVRGWFGEGTSALGDFYQLSNQRTLGRDEEQAVEELARVAERVLEYERQAREKLVGSDRRARVEDRVFRAEGALRSARLLTVAQVMACASDLRLGRALGLLEIPDVSLNRLALFSQPAHLANRVGCPTDGEAARWERARWVRDEMASIDAKDG